ncbi:mediator complex subunit MED14 [Xylaria sp. CBS 124048]|nr:mediator complex subunit MED14 [Xylaria sp. CBS 124048]
MPGVVMMENGVSHLQSTNHDRNNGSLVNGARDSPNDLASQAGSGTDRSQPPTDTASRMNDLPDEIQHITTGLVPLGLLLSRLAQQTHNQLADEIMALAKMPIPSSATNGISTSVDASLDDNSPENLNKKTRLLKFVQERHGEWVKALVIANWSRKAEPVSKLIDLWQHMVATRKIYQDALESMITVKRSLVSARLPNPDLRSALHVLATGQAPWMPELNYIEPPQMTPEEQLRWIENLNTLLSIRLNLDDYDSIPEQFQEYEIESGRVTFKVPGEFEVDLSIVDEDPESQFWFVDFRFAFEPAPGELSHHLRNFLEFKVNEALKKDGLRGCYNFLHEYILTHKITEYVRQAVELSKGRWAHMLEVERLRRAMAIHYWSGRQPLDGPQSYIIIGVSSGKRTGSTVSQSRPSHLALRWFRDGIEVKDIEFTLDNDTISTEALLNRVIGKHVGHILKTFFDSLKPQGRFARHEASLRLNIVDNNPGESALTMQLSHERHLNIKVAPITGTFLAIPQSRGNFDLQYQLNKEFRRPIAEQVALLERFRCHYIEDELGRCAKTMGWSVCNPHPVKYEETKQFLGAKASCYLIWLKRRGLPDNWHVMVGQSLSEEQWWLTEVVKRSGTNKITTYARIPLSPGVPRYSDAFFTELTFISSAIISQIGILGAMHKERIKWGVRDWINPMLPPNMKVPSIHVKLSDILGRHHPRDVSKSLSSWAFDFVEINMRSITSTAPQPLSSSSTTSLESRENLEQSGLLASDKHCFNIVVDARVRVADPSRFGPLKGNVEHDVAFNERLGVFAFVIEAALGASILDTLAHRLQALSRLASSIDAIRQSPRDVQCEEITLNCIKFSYTDQLRHVDVPAHQNAHRWTASLDLETDDMKLILDPGNPQARAVEQFNRLINSDEGFQGVPWFLSITLPIHRALDSVESAWKAVTATSRNRVDVSVVSLDCYVLMYTLNTAGGVDRRLTLCIKLQSHHDAFEWHIYREEAGATRFPNDEFWTVLKNVWKSSNRVWRNLETSVAADVFKGAETLIKATDEAIRPLAITSPPMSKQSQPKGAVPRATNHSKNAAAGKARPQQAGQGGPVVISLDD